MSYGLLYSFGDPQFQANISQISNLIVAFDSPCTHPNLSDIVPIAKPSFPGGDLIACQKRALLFFYIMPYRNVNMNTKPYLGR